MQWRQAYKALKRRVAKTGPGKRLRQALRSRRARRKSRREAQLFIVAQADRPYFYAHWLDWAAENDPDIRSRITLGKLPAAPPVGIRVLHAWVQDPVRERSSAVFGQLEKVEGDARRAGADIIHPAAVLSNSIREVQFERLSRVGLRSPRVARIDEGFADDLGGLSLPVVVRRAWGHQAPMARLDTAAEVAEWLAAQEAPLTDWVATEYIDVRDDDGLYRKYRYILFDDRGVCRHLIISAEWEVRPKQRVLTDETVAEELRFVGGTCDAHDILNAARREFEFDIAAFDYSYNANGELIVWEVNPYPDLSMPRGRPGEYLGESVERTNRALAAFYRARLTASRWTRWPRRFKYSRTS